MRRTRRILSLYLALAAVVLVSADEAAAKDTQQAWRGRTVQSKTLRPASRAKPATRVQTIVLRYTGLSSLPPDKRNTAHAESLATSAEAVTPEARCARSAPLGTPSSSNDKVPPCLGLYAGSEPASQVKFRFDVALKSIGAPKDIFVGQCTAGSNSPACNNTLSEAHAEQERLADTLNRQRRYPVATLGVAVSF